MSYLQAFIIAVLQGMTELFLGVVVTAVTAYLSVRFLGGRIIEPVQELLS